MGETGEEKEGQKTGTRFPFRVITIFRVLTNRKLVTITAQD